MTILVESIPLGTLLRDSSRRMSGSFSLLGIDFRTYEKAEKKAAETGYLDDPKSNPDASKGDEGDTDRHRQTENDESSFCLCSE